LSGSADSPRARFIAGMRVTTPPLVGVVPFGLVTGVVSTAAGLAAQTMVMAIATFSGIVHIVSARPTPRACARRDRPTVAVLSLRLVITAPTVPWLFLPLR
jgi:hypothetical protein